MSELLSCEGLDAYPRTDAPTTAKSGPTPSIGKSRVSPSPQRLVYPVRTSFAWGGGRERCERIRLVASDSDFVVGDGSQVCGTSIALLLAVSGRPVKDGELTGDGAGALMEARR